jgi:hypothetical protein
MAGKVCFHFQQTGYDEWSGRAIDLRAIRWIMAAFGVDQAACINDTNTDVAPHWDRIPNNVPIPLEVYGSVTEFEIAHAGEDIWFCETEWEFDPTVTKTRLDQFTHPETCWYVLGPVWGFNPTSVGPESGRQWLYMPQATNDATHAIHFMSALLWDRYRRTL